jgi:hypothetical protein
MLVPLSREGKRAGNWSKRARIFLPAPPIGFALVERGESATCRRGAWFALAER